MVINKFRLIWLFLLLFLILIVAYLKIVPSGQLTYVLTYPQPVSWWGGQGFIGSLTPPDRVTIKSGRPLKIIGDPVYFSVATPRVFHRAQIEIIYKSQLASDTPLIETGILADNVLWRYRLAPIQNSTLDNLMTKWTVIASGTLKLIERNYDYSSLADFLDHVSTSQTVSACPTGWRSCLALYNIDESVVSLPVFSPAMPLVDKEQIINWPLVGAHQFYFYKNKGTAEFNFSFTDLNFEKKPADIKLNIFQGDRLIASQTLRDRRGRDGSNLVDNFSDKFQQNLETGLYKLEIKASNDIIIKQLSVNAASLAAVNHLALLNNGQKPVTIWTDSRYLQVLTVNPASLQTISFGTSFCPVTTTYQQINCQTTPADLEKVSLQHGGLTLSNNGVFAFSPEQLLNLNFKNIDRYWQPGSSSKFILADYTPPLLLSDGWSKATATLNLQGAYRENGQYSWLISIPGLNSGSNGGYIEIKKISINFYGTSFEHKFVTLFKKIFN